MIERPKNGFGIPMLEWFGRNLRHIFAKDFQHHKLKQYNLLNTKYIQKQHKKTTYITNRLILNLYENYIFNRRKFFK